MAAGIGLRTCLYVKDKRFHCKVSDWLAVVSVVSKIKALALLRGYYYTPNVQTSFHPSQLNVRLEIILMNRPLLGGFYLNLDVTAASLSKRVLGLLL